MKYNEWISKVIQTGNLCGNYTDKVMKAKSKLQIMNCVLDANGINFLCEIQEKGLPLPYETICKEFANYINGKYIAEFKNEKGNGYTSSIYCCYDNRDITVQTTLCCIMGGTHYIHIKENDFVKIYADKNTELVITCPDSSRCIVETWGRVCVNGGNGRTEVISHG